MKKNSFLGRTMEKMKKFISKLKNKDTSFFIAALCICLLSTVIIWKYTTRGPEGQNDVAKNDNVPESGINANVDPYNDYVKKVQEDYKKDSEETKKTDEAKGPDLNAMKVPLAGEVTKEYTVEQLVYYESIGEWRIHTGVDIKPNDTLMIVSAFAGKVEKITQNNLVGTEIIIDHGNNVKTMYSNLASSKVKAGDMVDKGQTIGNVGKCDSIESAEGPHLHFEITVDSKTVNPLDYIPGE